MSTHHRTDAEESPSSGARNPALQALCVRDGLAAWALAHPSRVALADANRSMSYAEVLSEVSSLTGAARSAQQRNPTGSLLPVIVDRSLESCLAILACESARIPYFPVDQATPASVINSRADRTGHPFAVLAPTGWSATLPHGMVALTPDDALPNDADSMVWGNGDSDVAIAVFTSGSTGTPKAVALDWAARDARWRRRLHEPRREDTGARATLVLPPDSAWGIDVVCSVACGYAVQVVEAPNLHPRQLLQMLADFESTHLDVPPQLLRVLASAPAGSLPALPSLEFLRVGSEPLHFEFLDGIRKLVHDDVMVEHAYGASECGWIFRHRFPISDAPLQGRVPLGAPIYDGTVKYSNREGDESDLMEVFASGPISCGYLGDPDETARRFVRHDDGVIWWRSGDLVRIDDAGVVWHEGRADDIVKVRGKLVSPAEVVGVITQVEGVAHAVVLPIEQGHNVRLVAHIVLKPGGQTRREDVQSALDSGLPPHAVPSAVFLHETLPTNERGKVDRKRLMEGPFSPW